MEAWINKWSRERMGYICGRHIQMTFACLPTSFYVLRRFATQPSVRVRHRVAGNRKRDSLLRSLSKSDGSDFCVEENRYFLEFCE